MPPDSQVPPKKADAHDSTPPSSGNATDASNRMHDEVYGRPNVPKAQHEAGVPISPEALKRAAEEIRDALDRQNFFRDADTNRIETILLTMSESDRKALIACYRKMTGKDLKSELETHVQDQAECVKLTGLLERQDGKPDVSSHTATLLAKLSDISACEDMDRISGPHNVGTVSDFHKEQRRVAERDLLTTIGDLDSASLAEVKAKYEQQHPGHSFEQDLTTYPHISPETRSALGILLKGSDKLSKDDILKLADIGLNSHHVDIFLAAFRSHSPAVEAARSVFEERDGQHRIEQAFSGTDLKCALDYRAQGRLSLRTLIEGNHHFWNTNKPGILEAIEHATPEERNLYARGQSLSQRQERQSNTLAAPPSLRPEDKAAYDFYKAVHGTLTSSGSAKEVAVWEAHLLSHSGSFADSLAVVPNNNRAALLRTIENISANDWQNLKAHREDLASIDNVIRTFASDADRQEAMRLLNQKLDGNVQTYDKSQKVGQRSIDAVITGNGPDREKIDAITHMSAKDQESYRTNAGGFRDHFNQIVNASIKDETASLCAQRLLKKVDAGKQPVTDVDAVLIAKINQDGTHSIDAIENAFKQDPTLRERLRHPSTTDDKALRRAFCETINFAALSGGYSCQSPSQEGQNDWFSKPLWETGTLPLCLKLALHKSNESAQIQDILHADKAEQQIILNAQPNQPLEKGNGTVLQDPLKRQLVQNELRQNGPDMADRFRAFTLGIDSSPMQLQYFLERMSGPQRQDLANQYFQKYGHLLAEDVLAKLPADQKQRFTELLSPAQSSPKQRVLEAREDAAKHVGPLDQVMRDHWDYSKLQSEERLNDLSQFLTKHKTDIDKLSPEDRATFEKAIADYQTAQKNYVDSKGKMADAFVDATITVAAIGGSLFTGGVSLELLTAVGAGGAAYRVGAMSTIQGSDFDGSAQNALQQCFKGALSADLMFFAPGGGVIKVGENIAPDIAARTIIRMTGRGLERTSLREGEAGAEQLLAREIAGISRQEAVSGGRALDKHLDTIVSSLLKDSTTDAEKQALKNILRSELKRGTMNDIKSSVLKMAVHEGEGAAISMGTGAGVNAISEVASTVVGLEDPNTLWERVKGSAIAGAGGALLFHCAFKVGQVGYRQVKALIGKDANGLFAGEGTVIQHRDGTTEQVAHAERYRFHDGDQVVERQPKDILVIDAPYGQEVTYHGQKYHLCAKNNGTDFAEIGHKVELDVPTSQFADRGPLTPGTVVGGQTIDGVYGIWQIEKVNGDGTLHVVSYNKDSIRVNKVDLVKENPSLIRANTASLSKPVDNAQDVLQTGKLTLDTNDRHYGGNSGHSRFTGTVIDPATGEEIPVLVHDSEKSRRGQARLQNDLRAYKLSKEIDFDNGFPTTGVRTVEIDGKPVSALVQEYRGITVYDEINKLVSKNLPNGDRMAIKVDVELLMNPNQDLAALEHKLNEQIEEEIAGMRKQGATPAEIEKAEKDMAEEREHFYKEINNPELLEKLRTDPELIRFRQQLEEALVERQIYGAFDAHALNFVVVGEGDKLFVRNIDLDSAFSNHENPGYQIGHCEFGNIQQVLETISDQPLPPELHEKLVKFLAKIESKEGKRRLREIGFTELEIQTITSRTKWFVDHNQFPRFDQDQP